MRRLAALRALAGVPGLRVVNLGYPSREMYHAADAPENFYMLGSMGLASSIGIGVALGVRERVVAIDGDGSVLMNLGTFATFARYAPPNLILVVLDNGVHGSTGDQPTATSSGARLDRIAAGAGVRRVRVVRDPRALLRAATGRGPAVVVARIEPGNADVPVVPLDGPTLRDRFRARAASRRRVPRPTAPRGRSR